MKKIIIKLLASSVILCVSFLIISVIADVKPEIKKVINTYQYSAVLYSDSKLYYWGSDYYEGLNPKNKIIENVKQIIKIDSEILAIIDNDNNLKFVYIDEEYNDETSQYDGEVMITDVLKPNVKRIDSRHVLTIDNKLYDYTFVEYNEQQYEEKLIMNNVIDWSYNRENSSYLLLDKDNKLYAYGTNIFGKKVNDGEDIKLSPILIAENVKEFSCDIYGYNSDSNITRYGNFYLTNDNKLYVMSNELPYAKLLKENVSKFLYNKYYVSDGKTYEIHYRIENDLIDIYVDELILDEELVQREFHYNEWYLTEKGNLYYYDQGKKYSNIKQIYRKSNDGIYMLTEDGVLSSVNVKEVFNRLTNNYEYVYTENQMLNNVKEMLNEDSIIMEDETIFVRGTGLHDIANFNGNDSSKYNNFVIIKGIPNVPENIMLSQINLNYTGKTEFVVGNTFDFYAELYPYNATDKEIIWESSDENVVKVNENGTLTFISEGKATISVKSKNSNISDEIEIFVYPKNSGIEILGDEEISVNKYKEKLLKVKITPENTLPQKIKWTSNAGKDEYGNNIISFYGINHDNYYCSETVCPKSYDEIAFEASKTGVYTLTATTEDGLYSDSITVKVEQGITSLGLNPDRNNLLGSTLYIYMSESNYMDLNVKIYPEDATNKEIEYTSSDESIATVDATGRITAKRSGKVAITYKAKNYDIKNTINVLIFDKSITTKIGDVDGDGVVDILDLVKLRRHVAGVEALQ